MATRTSAGALAAGLLVCGCEVGTPRLDDTESGDDLAPVSQHGFVDAPLHGAVIPDRETSVVGWIDQPKSVVVVEYWDAEAAAWLPAVETSSAGTPSGETGLYRFVAPIARDDARWPVGGLAHLRISFEDTPLAFFDGAADDCRAGNTSWQEGVARCRSGAGALTLVSPGIAPAERSRYLDLKGAVDPAATRAYYAAIDAPATVLEFISRYGLDDEGTAVATYYNRGDLGIGREMHCDRFPASNQGDGVACYVRNYGEFGGERAASLGLAIEGEGSGVGEGAFATVAMVYEPPSTAPNAVRFMVYAGGTGALLDEAQLDSRGDNVSIPSNCINCHGSTATFDPATSVVSGARFLPFDLAAFDYTSRVPYRRADQESRFAALNQMVLATSPPEAMAEVIRGWYEGSDVAADPRWVPPAWDHPTTRSVYREVIAPFCRGCHASREPGPLLFDTPESLLAFPTAAARIACASGDPGHTMPNAEAAQRAFWAGPARAYLAGMLGAESFGTCAP